MNKERKIRNAVKNWDDVEKMFAELRDVEAWISLLELMENKDTKAINRHNEFKETIISNMMTFVGDHIDDLKVGDTYITREYDYGTVSVEIDSKGAPVFVIKQK